MVQQNKLALLDDNSPYRLDYNAFSEAMAYTDG